MPPAVAGGRKRVESKRQGGASRAYIIRRLERERPDLAERLAHGIPYPFGQGACQVSLLEADQYRTASAATGRSSGNGCQAARAAAFSRSSSPATDPGRGRDH
jgi:hypothetical protein